MLSLHSVGKKFNRKWVFRNLSLELNIGDCLAITGANGSGKSTLLQMMAGYLTPSEGSIKWNFNDSDIPAASVYLHIAMAAPYLDLPEEYTLEEILQLYFMHKHQSSSITYEEMANEAWLMDSFKKPLKEYSSGMKQRAKLLLCFNSAAPFLFLDEPAANLDNKGTNWFNELVALHKQNRIIVICSNNLKEEAVHCNKFVSVEEY